MFDKNASLSPKIRIYFFMLFSLVACFALHAQTYSVGNSAMSISSYTYSALPGSATVRVSRSTNSGSMKFYLLVSDATLDHLYQVGTRRLYKDSNISDSSLRIYVRPSSGSIEIGTTNSSGVVVASGTISSGAYYKDVTIKAVTGTGRVPLGTYSNSFLLQLYIGATSPPGGAEVASAIGSVNISVNSITYSTMTVSLASSTLNFGSALEEGQSPSAQTTLLVTAPARFSISAKSENSGYLKFDNEDFFPYKFYFNGSTTPVDLSGGIVRLIYSTSSVTNKSYSLLFTAGPLDFLSAGTYSDILSITFTSQ